MVTFYRGLNQFGDIGIVTSHNFKSGKSLCNLTNQNHHDHLIHLDCRRIIEFRDEAIEARQAEITNRYGMKLTNHSLYLHGYYSATHL